MEKLKNGKKIKRRKDEKKTLKMIGEVKMDQNGKSMGVKRNWLGNGLEMIWKWSWLMASTRVETAKTTKRRQNQLHYSQFFDFSSYLVEIVIWSTWKLGGKWNGSKINDRTPWAKSHRS